MPEIAQAYLDDIVAYSHSSSEHLQHLREVFERIQQAGLTVKLKKCCFGQDHTCYLGHMISVGKVHLTQRKFRLCRILQNQGPRKMYVPFLG